MINMFDRDRPLFNAFLRINHPWTAEMIAKSSFDLVTFDMQHGMIEYSDVTRMIASLPQGIYPMARLPQNDPGLTMKLLDAGVHGIICPQVKTPGNITSLVNACYYPPLGERSFGPMRAGSLNPNYVKEAQHTVTPFALIETKEALSNIESIIEIKGLKGLYVGPYDLSLSLGLEQMANFEDQEFLNIIKNIAATAKKHELVLAIQVYDLQYISMLFEMGYRVFGVFDDQILFRSSLQKRVDNIEKIRKQLT